MFTPGGVEMACSEAGVVVLAVAEIACSEVGVGVLLELGAELGGTTCVPVATSPDSEDVRWMGWEPTTVTHASECFPDLYNLAIKLITSGELGAGGGWGGRCGWFRR